MYIRSIGIAGILLGILFKIMQWPGANILLVLTLVGGSAWFLLRRERPRAAGR